MRRHCRGFAMSITFPYLYLRFWRNSQKRIQKPNALVVGSSIARYPRNQGIIDVSAIIGILLSGVNSVLCCISLVVRRGLKSEASPTKIPLFGTFLQQTPMTQMKWMRLQSGFRKFFRSSIGLSRISLVVII